jgi:tellurite resistance protein TerC
VKLVLHALHEIQLPFLHDEQPIPVPKVSIAVSLLVIVGVLGITTVASLVAVRRNPSLAGHGGDLVDTQVTSDASPHTAPENPVPGRDNATATPDRC